MKRIIAGVVVGGLVVAAAIAFFYQREAQRLSFAASLFSGAEQYERFDRLDQYFPTVDVAAPVEPTAFPTGPLISMPATFEYLGETVDTEVFLEETDTSALLVLQDGALRYERYMLTGGPDVRWLSMSVAKSFVSAALGIAVAEGHIERIEDPVTKYVPSLAGSAYDGVSIKDVLQMSSGASWNEDYSDPESDINRIGRVLAVGGSLESLAATMEPDLEPGTFNRYNSMDTTVLTLVLVRATGRTVADFMEEKLWRPIGAESPAFWLIDSDGVEMGFFGLNATARDYAKFGELYRRGGDWFGAQLVPADWVTASVTPDAPHLMPGDHPFSDYPMGYGYQWWVMDGDEGEYSAIGVYNQFIYVNPAKRLVIVKLSANSDYGTTADESSYREFETLEFFRAVGDAAG